MSKWISEFKKHTKLARRDILPFFLIRFFKNHDGEIYCYQLYFGWWNWNATLDCTIEYY